MNEFLDFHKMHSQRWKNLAGARERADAVLKLIEPELAGIETHDIACVFFGSLARREWTNGSDVDWTLLVDGQADAGHYRTAQSVRGILESLEYDGKPLIEPGESGLFGTLTFSHQLVHKLGGEQDTNINTSRRMLLLLESTSSRPNITLERTTRTVVDRYLADDFRFDENDRRERRVPRFLLNDIFRFWRTLCVDFGMKRWNSASKWALRNVKLRISRKWLFVSGMLTMFACELPGENEDGPGTLALITEYARKTPADILVTVLPKIGLEEQARRLLDIYDEYLGKINDESVRQHLSTLSLEDAPNDPHFKDFREIGRRFQESLRDTFFETNEGLANFTKEYGVF